MFNNNTPFRGVLGMSQGPMGQFGPARTMWNANPSMQTGQRHMPGPGYLGESTFNPFGGITTLGGRLGSLPGILSGGFNRRGY